MTIHVERYWLCHRCKEKVSVGEAMTDKLVLSYYGAKEKEYINVNKDVLCSKCSVEFLNWIGGK